jgi:pimeloyl-ACP methyl ester carboxylesterase
MRLHTHRIPGLILTDHQFRVPLDHAAPDGEQLTIFAREAVAPGKEEAGLPWLVFFQGGPGFPAARPDAANGWLKRALQEYRVLLLDQRGVGLSTPLTHQTLARFALPQEQADYTARFRADNIVRDAELIRAELAGPDARWSVLGQSFGGFCVTHYLSAAPAGLKEAFITGGLPPLDRHADDIYRATYRRVIEKNRLYFERYPEDQARAREIADALAAHDVMLPTGGRLTPRRFQQLGIAFGSSVGFEEVHYLLETVFADLPGGPALSYGFLRGFENRSAFETNPIYALLHEAEYCQEEASNWSAERIRGEYPEFSPQSDQPLLFTGEMVYPWMFDEYPALQPLKEAADLLAAWDGWPRLYDAATLRVNEVPCAAVAYHNDMYVERTFSEETAADIQGLKLWVTSEYEHNGLRADGEHILGRLIAMARGEA